jgi:DNA mismatch endonuclease (patch repair protein)
MAKIRSKGNKSTELRLVAILREHRVSGWRRNMELPGRPDFVFRKHRLAVFVDGCFWHGCPLHCRMPKSRIEYWKPKIARNKKRDKVVQSTLRASGWRVLRIWEHELSDNKRVAEMICRWLA